MYSIEKGIPIPNLPKSRGRSTIYPFADMEIGDSFFVPNVTTKQLGGMCTRVSKKFGFTISRRTTTEGGVTGVRTWRTA